MAKKITEFQYVYIKDLIDNHPDDYEKIKRITSRAAMENPNLPLILYELDGTTTERIPEYLKNAAIIIAKGIVMINPKGKTTIQYLDIYGNLQQIPLLQIQNRVKFAQKLGIINKEEIQEDSAETFRNAQKFVGTVGGVALKGARMVGNKLQKVGDAIGEIYK